LPTATSSATAETLGIEIAKLVLEYLRALVWPLVAIFLVLLFRRRLDNILSEFTSRMSAAEKLKFGVMGQELEISGTARELLKKREELLTSELGSEPALRKAEQIEKSIEQLSDPMADFVGIALVRGKSGGLSLAEITHTVVRMIAGRKAKDWEPGTVLLLSKSLERILTELIGLNLVSLSKEKYRLTNEGRALFQKVWDRQRSFLRTFATLSDQA
jgi:hypothetical protein